MVLREYCSALQMMALFLSFEFCRKAYVVGLFVKCYMTVIPSVVM